MCKIAISFEIKFSYIKCVANLFLVPILEPFWRRLEKLFETITLPSKRMERQTTPSIAGQTSLHKSLSPQKEKSRITIETTVPQSPIHFTPNTCASAAERHVKNTKFALKFASSATNLPKTKTIGKCLWPDYQKQRENVFLHLISSVFGLKLWQKSHVWLTFCKMLHSNDSSDVVSILRCMDGGVRQSTSSSKDIPWMAPR